MSHANQWSNPSGASAKEIAEMGAALEERGRAFDQQEVNSALINVVAPSPGEQLVEAGCGTGVLCRSIAPKVAPDGKITGLDSSHELIHLAQKYAEGASRKERIQWCTGRAEALPFPDASFDGALAARLLLHVSDPQAILRDLARVVRPGGKLVAMDWDFDTVAVDHSNRELTRRLLHWRCDHEGGNNWSGRQLYNQMAGSGLSHLTETPFVSVAHREQDSLTRSLFRAAQLARDGGEITPAEYDSWVGELRYSLSAGCFLASIVYFIVSAEL